MNAIGPGKPPHLQIKDRGAACGIVWATYTAYDPRDVNCLRCRNTNAYKTAMHDSKPGEKP